MGWVSRLPAALAGAILLIATGAGSASAQGHTPRANGIFGTDNRAFILPSRMPWSAIGRLEVGNLGLCSGALVSPRVVLTAAHCVYNDGGYYGRPDRFRAAYHKGRSAAVSTIASFWVPRTYERAVRGGEADDGYDYAFVLLDEPIGLDTGWFETHLLTEAELTGAVARGWRTLRQAGYSADTGEQMSANVGCPITAFFDDHTFTHLCDMMSGDSGSPLFVEKPGGGYEIIGVASKIYSSPRGFGIAVDSRAWNADLQRYLDRYDPRSVYEAATVEEVELR